MTISTADNFRACVERSRLIEPNALNEFCEALPPHVLVDPNKLARELVRQRMLTSWQADQLLAGNYHLIFGRYRLLEQVGIGGMGAVYKAEMTAMGRIVALKIMNPKLLSNAEAVARFEREVKAVSKLNHPNVVAAYDAICEGETYFLVMEFVDGGNLNQWLKKYSPLPVEWVCECIRQAAMGLQHAHDNGIVHRDIKPGNVLVAAESPFKLPVAKILDMGLVRMTQADEPRNLTREGQVLGTPDYIAPEQAHNTREADIRCDIFSLGVTMFKALTGELPYEGETAMEKIIARTTKPAPRVSTLRPDVPKGVDDVVAKMLARNPEVRYQTPWEVAQALGPFSLASKVSKVMNGSVRDSSIMTQAFSEMLMATAQQEEVMRHQQEVLAEQKPAKSKKKKRKPSSFSTAAITPAQLALGLLISIATAGLAALVIRLVIWANQ